MFLSVEVTTAEDPVLTPLIAAQEAEVMGRYGVADAGPGLSPGTPCLVARLGHRPVGCVAVAVLDNGPGELKRMYVAPDARGHGIGRRLLEDAERLATARGCRRLRLETGTAQPEALRLYESAGWSPIPCYGHFKDDPTTICLEKALSSSPR